MKRVLKILLLLAIWMVGGCRRTDVRDFSIVVPAMTEKDQAVLTAALADKFAGVERASIHFDFATKCITLKYDSMQLAKKNMEMAIAEVGFEANGVTPESVGARTKKATK